MSTFSISKVTAVISTVEHTSEKHKFIYHLINQLGDIFVL